MKKTGFQLLAVVAVAMSLVSCSQFKNSSKMPAAASGGLNGSVTAAAVAPYVRNAFVHDPSTIIKCKDEFWVFTTGRGVPSWHSKDLANWEHGPSVFTSNAPPWVAAAVPANRGMNYWAPDVTYVKGRYLLYYAA
jgi:beta-xylosidase